MRVVFPYLGQLHQVLHSLPVAVAMAQRHPQVEVHAAAGSDEHHDLVRVLLDRHAPGSAVRLHRLARPFLRPAHAKKRTMFLNRAYLRSFDAIVTPERTSLFLRRIGIGATRLIWTRHGAGDREVGFAPDIAKFDYVLLAGAKIEQALLERGLIRPGHYSTGIYAKFEWLKAAPATRRWFDDDRPVVLYNPHFEARLSSWPAWGQRVLDYFAASDRYNLIFAPHLRLFEGCASPRPRIFDRYAGLPHVHIDLGSRNSIDMSYTRAADLYLGDVSSQAAEFVVRPRPCIFLNAHGVRWQDSPAYESWHMGPVVEDFDQLAEALADALAAPDAYRTVQERYVAESFGQALEGSSADRAADDVVRFLARGRG